MVIDAQGRAADDGGRLSPHGAVKGDSEEGMGGRGCAPLDLAFSRDDLAKLRLIVTDRCVATGLAEPRWGDFVLAVHEVVSNAIVHAGGGGRLVLRRVPDGLICVVSDAGGGFDPLVPTQPPEPLDAETGRGLWLASQLTDRLDFSSTPEGTTVTLFVRVP
jgi:anti-sigma regulatory factor (Ser/Thr protein kinase)